jgi:hypothetical protein
LARFLEAVEDQFMHTGLKDFLELDDQVAIIEHRDGLGGEQLDFESLAIADNQAAANRQFPQGFRVAPTGNANGVSERILARHSAAIETLTGAGQNADLVAIIRILVALKRMYHRTGAHGQADRVALRTANINNPVMFSRDYFLYGQAELQLVRSANHADTVAA